MRVFRRLACLFLLIVADPAIAFAQDETEKPQSPPLLPDIARIVERGSLVVGQMKENLPPVFFETETGEPAGFDNDLAKAIAAELEVDLEVRRTAESFDDVIRQVAAGEVDMGISFLTRSPSRARLVLFSRPYAREHHSLLINRLKGLRFRAACPSLEELLRTSEIAGALGLRAGTASIEKLRKIEPDARPREFESYDDLVDALLAGDIAISLQSEILSGSYLQENPAARIRFQHCRIGRYMDLIGIAVPPGRYDLLNWVNVFLESRDIDFDAAEIVGHQGPWIF